MLSTRCPFCDHGNPADSRFCGACGGALHLQPCPNCGAVADVAATVCYQCRSPLQPRAADTLDDPPPPAAAATNSQLTDLLKRLVAGGDFPPPGSGSEASTTRAGDTPSRLVARIAMPPEAPTSDPAPDAAPAPSPGNATPAPAAAEMPGESSPAAEPGVAPRRWLPLLAVGAAAALLGMFVLLEYRHQSAIDNIPLPGDTAASPATGSEEKSAAPTRRPQPIAKGGERAPARPDGCTEAVAALGLCQPQSAQKPAQKADTVADRQAATPRTPAPAAGKAGARQPSRSEACTEAAAALGICVLQPPPSKE